MNSPAPAHALVQWSARLCLQSKPPPVSLQYQCGYHTPLPPRVPALCGWPPVGGLVGGGPQKAEQRSWSAHVRHTTSRSGGHCRPFCPSAPSHPPISEGPAGACADVQRWGMRMRRNQAKDCHSLHSALVQSERAWHGMAKGRALAPPRGSSPPQTPFPAQHCPYPVNVGHFLQLL
eukprot:CAMPEP_0174372464 /NCGR_PEP_ID=MMETSP0811_2-20130205/103698_1 /TAXON_ID=73025 ORGANISM="Eutreptiella gymnastica-like, Strain CCMP1594" /NCGR_SAMPLE_ID=MMETSP0811_2 /ASSEMBLY_ACC=CAM_ASM_000667 /LENGTH=175 /DNA_ID=CAMNT_0015519913 /DNA_START=119 /DNA_END=646 /DNA_ORIENTATION=+